MHLIDSFTATSSIVSLYGDCHSKKGETLERDRKWIGQRIDESLGEHSWILVENVPKNVSADATHSQIQYVNKTITHLVGWEDQNSLQKFGECIKTIENIIKIHDVYATITLNSTDQSSKNQTIQNLLEEINKVRQEAIDALNETSNLYFLPDVHSRKALVLSQCENINHLISRYYNWLINNTLPDRNLSLAETIIEHSADDVQAIAGLDHLQINEKNPEPEQKKAVKLLKRKLKEEDISYEIFCPSRIDI